MNNVDKLHHVDEVIYYYINQPVKIIKRYDQVHMVKSLYNEFISGTNSKPLMDIYKESEKGEWLATGLLNRNESLEEEEGKNVVTVEHKLQQLYDAIFVTEYTGNVYRTVLGEYGFDDDSKRFVKSVESMLSVYADYEV